MLLCLMQLCLMLLCLMQLAGSARAAPPVPGSDDAVTLAPLGDWVAHQYARSGQFCCTAADGRPAEVRQTFAGSWEVLYAREHWEDGTDAWLPVPPAAILRQPSPLAVPIAWISHGRVWCVALPATG